MTKVYYFINNMNNRVLDLGYVDKIFYERR